jgi:hypothetical protein
LLADLPGDTPSLTLAQLEPSSDFPLKQTNTLGQFWLPGQEAKKVIGARRDEKPGGDVLVGQPFTDQAYNVTLGGVNAPQPFVGRLRSTWPRRA